MRPTHLVPVSLLLATGCFSPGDDGRQNTTFDSASSSPTGPSGETEPGETEPGETDPGDPDPTANPDDSADSGEDTDPEDTATETESDASSDSGADNTAPTIVSISPENGATGVASDAAIVVTFSEPMSQAATQAAWESPNIGSAIMVWNSDDTVLRIVPSELEYATGNNPDTVVANEYSFTLQTQAADAAGNHLEEEVLSNFSTSRLIELEFAPVDALTGMTYPDGSINTSNVYVGDIQSDSQQKGVLTFALPSLPPGTQGVFEAFVWADQTVVGGSPYGALPGLGDVHLLDVEFPTNWDAWEADALADLGNFSTNDALATKQRDVTDAVIDDYDAGNENTQFRLEFPVATNGDGVLDRCTFDKPTIGMSLSYVIE